MSTIRTFVAVEIASQLRQRACELIERLSRSRANVKWVEPENLHLTLSFLGDVQQQRVHEVCASVVETAKSFRPFELVCHGVGAFPTPSRPRILWIGVQQGQDEICDLQRAIAKSLGKLGYRKDHRKFHPHFTLGRVRRGNAGLRQLAQALDELKQADVGPIRVEQIVVFSSQLQPSGPVYEAMARAPLARAL